MQRNTTIFAEDTYPFGASSQRYEDGGTAPQRFDFTGKERDRESGLHYFGARNYDSDLGIWYGVDPLADKYPGLSPYNYCLNNPVNVVDPNGKAAIYNEELTELNSATETSSGSNPAQGEEQHIDREQLVSGLTEMTGGLMMMFGGIKTVTNSSSLAGQVSGAIGTAYGVVQTGLGGTKVANAIKNQKSEQISGPLNALDRGLGGDGKYGELGDLVAPGLPTNGIELLSFSVDLVKTDAVQGFLPRSRSGSSNALKMVNSCQTDNTKVNSQAFKKSLTIK